MQQAQLPSSLNKVEGTSLEAHFRPFRAQIIGIEAEFVSPYGMQKLMYADWIASGRLYKPIEDRMQHQFGPMVGNTHSESSETGICMTQAYHEAHKIIKAHVHASDEDVLLTTGTGMTGALAKLQRILGLKIPEGFNHKFQLPESSRPVVFLTHLEHHSNQTSWLETIADVEIIPPSAGLRVVPQHLIPLLEKYKDRPLKIGSFTACSNVTGLQPDYYALAKIMHQHGGYCFVDFAASAPYLDMDMHPEDPECRLDAIFFSPHKFLGGPGSSGVLIFNKELYHNHVPDHPGGGTVSWTNPWGGHSYFEDIETREDGGTPGFLQAIRCALAINLKEKMQPLLMQQREEELLEIAFEHFDKIEGLSMLAPQDRDRLGVISFYIEDIHYNLVVKLLNDRFGIQVRGGCSCAGTYGHYLLHVDEAQSFNITCKIDEGDLSNKPGWVRLSLHPTMTNDELAFIMEAIKAVAENANEWKKDYTYAPYANEFYHKTFDPPLAKQIRAWFEI